MPDEKKDPFRQSILDRSVQLGWGKSNIRQWKNRINCIELEKHTIESVQTNTFLLEPRFQVTHLVIEDLFVVVFL